MFSACIFPFIKQATNSYKDIVGREMHAPPRGEGGFPRPAPSRKNDQNRGEVAGQNKSPNINFLWRII